MLLCCLASAGTGSVALAEPIFGPQRVLVVLPTWGPEPFTHEQVRQAVFGNAASFVRTSSYGRASLEGTVTPWLRALPANPGNCNVSAVGRAGRAAAAAAGFAPSSYQYVIYLSPHIGCPWFGVTLGTDIYLNGSLFTKLVEHELGHAFGLPHSNATSSSCSADACATEYGDPYDTMGDGVGDFNAFEKFLLGWLPRFTTVHANGEFVVDALEGRSAGSKALVVRTATDEYWIENRRDPGTTVAGEIVAPPGVLVRTGPPRRLSDGADYTLYNLLIADPVGRDRPSLFAGETFTLPGVFSITVRSRTAATARIRFRWQDRTRPRPPQLLSVRSSPYDSELVDVAWDGSKEGGSGVDRYLVSIDGRPPLVARRGERADGALSLARPSRGRHVVKVIAVDRAGNRSRPATRRFVVGS